MTDPIDDEYHYIPTSRIEPHTAREHQYLSTGCFHGDHAYCQSDTGAAGTKTPAQCKFCAAPCVCTCHRAGGEQS